MTAPDPMTGPTVDVDGLARLLEAAKDGDWIAERVFWKLGSTRGQADTYWWDVQDHAGTVALCSTDSDGDFPEGGTGKDRADLIIAAVNALPALLAALRDRDDLIRRQDAALTAQQAVIDAVTELADRWEREGAPAQWHGAVLHATIPSGQETSA